MDVAAIVQLVTVVVAAMAIIWHQQHSTSQLRAETREDFKTFRAENREDFRALREDHNKLNDAIAQNGQRLARIEGHLGIGIPPTLDESTDAEPS